MKEQEESPSLEYGATASVLGQGHPQAEGRLSAFLLWKSNFFDGIELRFLSPIASSAQKVGGCRLDVWMYPCSAGMLAGLSGA